MGDHYGFYQINSTNGMVTIGSDRIGGAGSGPCLIEQLLAGWSVAKGVNPDQARKARGWMLYRGPKFKDQLNFRSLRSVEDMILALTDDSDDCTWVHAGNYNLERAVLHKINDRELHSLVSLWQMTRCFYEYQPFYRVTEHMASACAKAVEALEEHQAAWHKKCRDFNTILQRAKGVFGYVQIG